MSIELVIREIDGVEFYTDAATGKSGISQSGLARLCGVSQPAISKLVKSVITGKAPERLESLHDKVKCLITQTASGVVLYADELCTAIIKYYAFKGYETAQFTLEKFLTIGFNTWVQSITGWQTPETSAQPQPQPIQQPTPEQIEFMKSRGWEKAELEGNPMTPTDIAKAAGLPSSNDSALALPNDAAVMAYAEKMRRLYEHIELQRWLERCLQK